MINSIYIRVVVFALFMLTITNACKKKSIDPDLGVFQLLKVTTDGRTLSSSQSLSNISVNTILEVEFSNPADTQAAKSSFILMNTVTGIAKDLMFDFKNDNSRILISPSSPLDWNTEYRFEITNSMKSITGAGFPGVTFTFITENGSMELITATINGINLKAPGNILNIDYDQIEIQLSFSEALNQQNYKNSINILQSAPFDYELSADNKTVTLTSTADLNYYTRYIVSIGSSLTAENGFIFEGFNKNFLTGLNSDPKFPIISDEDLLDKVTEYTFRYFWDFAHPVSGLIRERNSSGEIVTIGGSGFGIKAIIVGIHRGFITREEGVERLGKIINFLSNAERFHGVWPHWMNGSTGSTVPFSANDNGADLVETSFMAQGLITARQFMNTGNAAENDLVEEINELLDTIEWTWFTRNGQNVLYWHWSPNFAWAMNMQVKGYNEALIVYILAASSKNYSINSQVYHSGWASSGAIQNGKIFYGYNLPVGFDYGGPLFFAHYSFLGLDPRGLTDTYADYWVQNINHTLINREHSIRNPYNYMGYSADSWGLTASDDHLGYGVHEPTRDNGTITPTAALSSMPYTPEESMQAMKHFYYVLGDKLWGQYGFYDSFNPTQGWWSNAYLAIDQGPIIIMIENHRSGLLWDLFMSAPEIQTALDRLGFTSASAHSISNDIN